MDFRLVAADMDGTLLDGKDQVPEKFWDILGELHDRGIVFAPASGRQLATLEELFEDAQQPLSYIAENGSIVSHNGAIISLTTLPQKTAHAIVTTVRKSEIDTDMGVIICGPECAYVERSDEPFLQECRRYYTKLKIVNDLVEILDDQILKVAVFSFTDAATTALPLIQAAAPDDKVILSGELWIDVMNPQADKGVALKALRTALGLEKTQTVAFGDYLNDLGMLHEAGVSYAMANAHPELLASADKVAPSNVEEGVITILDELLGKK